MIVRAQFTTNNQRIDRMRKYVTDKRAMIEQSRTIRVKRIQSDVERICKREWEYAKHMAEEVLPFKLTWNEDAMKKFKDMMPFTVEVKEELEESTEVTEVVDVNAPPS
jgi:hypothetical protein